MFRRDPNLRFWIFPGKGNAVSVTVCGVYRYQSITNSLSQNRSRFGHFLGTARLSASDSIIEGGAHILGVEGVLSRSFHPSQNNKHEGRTYMKKLLLIALVVSGWAFVPVQRSDAQISVGIGGVGIGFGYPGYGYSSYGYGYPGYGYGYYPYGYYRSYPYYSYYTGPSYYWSGGRRYYRHRHHYYRRRY